MMLRVFGLLVLSVLLSAPAMSQLTAEGTHTSYDLHVQINPDRNRLEVSGWLSIPAPLPHPLRIALSRSFPAPVLYVVNGDGAPAPPVHMQQAWQNDRVTAWDLELDLSRVNGPLVLGFNYSGGGRAGRIFGVTSGESYGDGATDPWYPQLRASEREDDVPNVTGNVWYEFPANQKLVSSGRFTGGASTIAMYAIDRPQPISFALGAFQSATSPATASVPAFELNYIARRPDIGARRDWVRSVLERYVRW